MEMERQISLGKKPLPGERQGTLGAGAECDSGRTTGGRMLRSRAPAGVAEETTALIETSSNHDEETHGELAASQQQVAVQAIQTRTNRKLPWTKDEYSEIIWCYYYMMEKKNASEKEVYNIWRIRNPEVRANMDSKKLASQRRYVINNRKFTQIELDQIKEGVVMEISKERVNRQNRNEESWGENVTDESEELVSIRESSNNDTVDQQCTVSNLEYSDNKIMNADKADAILKTEIQVQLQITNDMEMDERDVLPKIRENEEVKLLIASANNAIEELLREQEQIDITLLNNIIYSTAVVISKKITNIKYKPLQNNIQKKKEPPWKKRIEEKIKNLRKELSLVSESDKTNISTKTKTKINLIKEKYNQNNDNIPKIKEILKEKILAYSQRIRRYNKRNNFYHQNKIFQNDPKRFYRQIRNRNSEWNGSPSQEQIEQFWKQLWNTEAQHNIRAQWIEREEKHTQKIPFMTDSKIKIEDIAEAIRNTGNWKTSGPDKITNFWIKKLTALHCHLSIVITQLIENPEKAPRWLTEGVTYLIPKNNETAIASNYRPITCLSVLYKLITSIISSKIYTHLIQNDLFPTEQKGCAKGSYGCKELLFINKTVIEDCKRKKKGLSMAWVDYRKAYDSVPHSWIEHTLKLYHLDPNIVNFCVTTMHQWKTKLILSTPEQRINTDVINIRRGIFQGDTLSPLLFCMSLIPLTRELKQSRMGYKITSNETISNMLYMDDLKLFAKNEEQLTSMLQTVSKFSKDINMQFGLDKCATASIVRGRMISTKNIIIDENMEIENLENEKCYKYLGIDEREGIDHRNMKEKLKKEYITRIRKILHTELTGKNKILAVGTLAVPVLEYSFGLVNWTDAELKKIDRKTRKLLTMGGLLHPRADIDRIYVSRNEGGRGLRQVERSHMTAVVGMANYFQNSNNNLAREIAKVVKQTKGADNIFKTATKIKDQYQLNQGEVRTDNVKKVLKESLAKELKQKWEAKPLHGQFLHKIAHRTISKEHTFRWLKEGRIKGETEALITAAQDQALKTRYYEKKILKINSDGKCRICHQGEEHIDHVVSGCPELAKREYVLRHDKVCNYVHWAICKQLKIPCEEKWYKHQPPDVVENNDITIIRDQQIHTDRKINANKPDIILKDLKRKVCILIDVAVPADHNVIAKEAEKILKYKDLAIEIQRMWQVKAKVIPVVVGALGTISTKLQTYLNEIPAKIYINQIQHTALCGTAHILRKVLD